MYLSADSLKEHIPFYLTEELKTGLVRALNDFPDHFQYFCSGYEAEMLQGDCWTGFTIFNHQTGERRFIRGLVVSNTCDVDPDNKRDLPVWVSFAPMVSLGRFQESLLREGISQDAIDSKVSQIRLQRVTDIFYVPNGLADNDEHIALLGQIQSMPLKVFNDTDARRKVRTLSMQGFYMYILKISVHLCRLHEGVARG